MKDRIKRKRHGCESKYDESLAGLGKNEIKNQSREQASPCPENEHTSPLPVAEIDESVVEMAFVSFGETLTL